MGLHRGPQGRRTATFVVIAVVMAWVASGCLWTQRINVTSSGGQSQATATPHDISDDGRFVLFSSNATDLVPGVTTSACRLYRRDNSTGAVVVASVGASGSVVSPSPCRGTMSGDGRRVAFDRSSDDAAAGDRNGKTDVFVRDLTAGTTVLASVPTFGGQAFDHSHIADLSADGRYVLFLSAATNITPGGHADLYTDAFVRDLQEQRTVAATYQFLLYIDGEGWFDLTDRNNVVLAKFGYQDAQTLDVNFAVAKPDPSDPLHNRFYLGYSKVTGDWSSGSMTAYCRINPTPDGGCARLTATWPTYFTLTDIDSSKDVGAPYDRILISHQTIDPYSGQTTARVRMVEPYDLWSTTPITPVDGGQGATAPNGLAYGGRFADDGKLVAFQSTSTNLVPSDTNGQSDIFIREIATNTVRRHSLGMHGEQGNGASNTPVISADGKFVAFRSSATNFVGAGQVADTNGVADVFERVTEQPPAISQIHGFAQLVVPPGGSRPVTITGQRFASNASLGASPASVQFSNVDVVDDTTITATMTAVPGAPEGVPQLGIDLWVTNTVAPWGMTLAGAKLPALRVGTWPGIVRSNAPLWPQNEAAGRGSYRNFHQSVVPAGWIYADPGWIDDLLAPSNPLTTFACIILPVNTSPFSSAERAALRDYVQAGGTLVAVGESPDFPGGNATMNALSAYLGAHVSIVAGSGPHDAAGFASTTDIASVPPYTTGVSSIGYGAAGRLDVTAPAQVLVRTPAGVPILAVESVGAGRLVMSSDSNMLSNHNNGAYTAHDNDKLSDNLCRWG